MRECLGLDAKEYRNPTSISLIFDGHCLSIQREINVNCFYLFAFTFFSQFFGFFFLNS